MKVLNFGSLNYDHVYQNDHFVKEKETISSLSYKRGFGGKGLNQSIALAKANVQIYHAGKVGNDGQDFIDYLKSYNVNTDYLIKDNSITTGHAIIEVVNGQNRIILHGGANTSITEKDIDETLKHFEANDILLIQNEISNIPYLLKKAHEKKMKIYFNTAPMDSKVFTYPLDYVDTFIANEVEGAELSKCNSANEKDIIDSLKKTYPTKEIILTCGEKGSYYIYKDKVIFQDIFPCEVKDTIAAGDTFTGFYLASIINGDSIEKALETAAKASSITCSKEGAAKSIPSINDIK